MAKDIENIRCDDSARKLREYHELRARGYVPRRVWVRKGVITAIQELLESIGEPMLPVSAVKKSKKDGPVPVHEVKRRARAAAEAARKPPTQETPSKPKRRPKAVQAEASPQASFDFGPESMRSSACSSENTSPEKH